MDRNTLLAFALSMLIFSGWLSYESMRQPPSPEPGEQGIALETTDDAKTDGLAASQSENEAKPSLEGDSKIADSRPPPARANAGATATWQKTYNGGLFEAMVDNRGGGITSWRLLDPRYSAVAGREDDPIDLVTRRDSSPVLFATPLLELELGDLSEVLWEVESSSFEKIVFRYSDEGIEIRKQIDLRHDEYEFDLSLEIVNRSDRSLRTEMQVLWPGSEAEGNDFKEQSLVTLADEDVERERIAGVGSGGMFGGLFGGAEEGQPGVFPGPVSWIAVETRYFVSALIPEQKEATASFEPIVPGTIAAATIAFPMMSVHPGESVKQKFRGYIGPKVEDTLESVDTTLVRSIDLGYSWLEPLTLFFHWLLATLYGVIPNYGVAIIIVTILVRVVTLPIMGKQMKSMENMRALQPKLKEIQERFKEDRQRQSEETMKLYKEEGVNPLGGCFPMLLQFPVFIGLFYALQSTIELRHAPFALWITDLSAPESLFVMPGLDVPVRLLPIIMGASMVLQQRMTPTTGMDPAQAKMMTTIMPIMMTVLFYQFPSGLVLYWMISNFLGIGHQLWVRRNMEAEATPA